MALFLPGEQAFTALASAAITFTYRVNSFAIWTNDDDLYIKPDGTAVADATSHRIPANTYISLSIPCKTLGIIGATGAGTAYWVATYPAAMVSDVEAESNRGGVHLL